MKVLSVVGTRPNFIKEYALQPELARAGVNEITVHTGQHYDYWMSRVFFEELELARPNYITEILKGRQGQETAMMLSFLEEVLLQERPDVTLVYGDVNSTLAAALASAKLGIPIAHVEAGLRSGDLNNPEEINRKVTDVLSDTLFPHIQEAYDSLMAEGFSPGKVFLVGDVVKDSLMRVIEKHGINIQSGNYHVVTVHRQENTDSRERLGAIVESLIRSGEQFKFPVHPRTRKQLERFGLTERLASAPRIELLNPMGYLDFVRLLAGCRKVLTDSGGVRREAYILEKPVINLAHLVWVPAMVRCGWSVVTDADTGKILEAIKHHDPDPRNRPELFGDGHAAGRIVKILRERYGKRAN